MKDEIIIEQARQHNLQIKELRIPMHQMVGVTGPSGSGKSSLVVHTIYAESQRKYLSSLSTYQRQFFERWSKPDVESIQNLGASLLIGQKNQIRNSRATVATTSGLYPLLADLYANFGKRFCPECHSEIIIWEPDKLHHYLKKLKGEVWLGFPFEIASDQTIFRDEISLFLKQGLDQLCLQQDLDKETFVLRDLIDPSLIKVLPGQKVVFVISQVNAAELDVESLEEFLRIVSSWSSTAVAIRPHKKHFESFALQDLCGNCGAHYGQLLPGHFSFYSSLGACQTCNGFGAIRQVDPHEIASRMDKRVSLEDGFFPFLETKRFSAFKSRFLSLCRKYDVPVDKPWKSLSSEQKEIVLFGKKSWKGLKGLFDRLERKKYRMTVRIFLNALYSERVCEDCQGDRLVPKSRSVTFGGKTLPEVVQLNIRDVKAWFENAAQKPSVLKVFSEPLLERLNMMIAMGIGYLDLGRKSRYLSGGEVQRLSIVHHIGTNLSDTLYIMDEPSIGLHPRDCQNLTTVCHRLVKQGNHALIIEHDPNILDKLDHLIEMGPGSGKEGGSIVWQGEQAKWEKRQASQIQKRRFVPKPYDPIFRHWIELEGCKGHNLRDVHCRIPLQNLIGVCGVSGSGKTTLILDTLVPYLEKQFGRQPHQPPSEVDHIKFPPRWVSDVDYISQALPIRSSRANLLTFTGAFDHIRRYFANTLMAKKRRMKPGHFSFNSDLGRCMTCKGSGEIVVEMIFMEDLYIPCSDCGGKRFKDEVLEIEFKNKNISDVLALTVDEAIGFFEFEPKLKHIFSVLKSVGIGYMTCGQGIHTFSGGELQRLKISRIFLTKTRRNMLYVLDEPTTGLHEGEVRQLIHLFHQMITKGHTVLVIEHNPELLAQCDYLIELGPGGGDEGGQVVFQGPTSDIRQHKGSMTAPFL